MRRALVIAGVVIIGLVVVALALPAIVNVDQFRPAIESELTRSLGRQVKIGNLKLSILSGTVTITDLTIADDPSFSRNSFLTTKALTLSIDLWQALFSHRLNVDGMSIESPDTVLVQAPSGVWNFSSLGAKAAGGQTSGQMSISMKSLKINGARLSLTQGRGAPRVLDDVSIEVKDFAPGSVFPFSLSAKIAGGGTVALDGKAGPINPADAANTPLTATVKIAALNLAASGALPASSGVDGVASLDGSASSNGSILTVTGRLTADKLKLAKGASAAHDPLLVDFALTDDLRQHSGQMTKGDIAIGGVKASLTGSWTQPGDSPVLKMMLAAPAVPVSALTQLLPVMDITLPAGSTPIGGTAAANLAVTGTPAALVIAGPVGARDTQLKGFNLGTKLSPIEKLAGIKSGPDTEIQTLSANLRTSDAGTTLQDIHVVLPSIGEMTGSGTISAGHALNFRMRASLHGNALTSVFAPPNIPFSIEGTASDPRFRPDVGQLATAEINRGLNGVKAGGVDAGKAADGLLQGLFGGRKRTKAAAIRNPGCL